jgi:hypothetical protein
MVVVLHRQCKFVLLQHLRQFMLLRVAGSVRAFHTDAPAKFGRLRFS